MALKHFYYDHQVKKYLLQFMAIFGGLQVQIGRSERSDEEKLISVPIIYGNRDRVVGSLKSDHTQNKPLRVPIMSTNIVGMDLAPDLRKGIGSVRRNTYLPLGGVIPDDVDVVKQLMPIPYKLNVNVDIWVTNSEQRYQILEQILTVFDPIVQIQKNDSLFDWTKITTVELVGINYEDNYPILENRRVFITSLSFQFPIYLSAPANIKDDFIKDIYVRIGAVSQEANTNEEIIAELDAQGIQYELWFDGETIDLDQY